MKKNLSLIIFIALALTSLHAEKIYKEMPDGSGMWVEKTEYWHEYDEKGNQIYVKDSFGHESWYEYDSKGNEIHYKDSDGKEEWSEYEYNSSGKVFHKVEYKRL